MPSYLETIKELLLSNKPDFDLAIDVVEAELSTLTGIEHSKCRTSLKLLKIYSDLTVGDAGSIELASSLRQYLRVYKQDVGRLLVSNELFKVFEHDLERVALKVIRAVDNHQEIVDKDWQPSWLRDAKSIDALEYRSGNRSCLGDGMLSGISKQSDNWRNYKSKAQKAAIATYNFSPPGSTTLITLPTGDGKSLIPIISSWINSQRGRAPGGSIIVIVPTVSLALDQQRQARKYFPNAQNERYKPWARVGGMTDEDQGLIIRGVKEGTIPLLYLSPESLMNTQLYQACLVSASKGYLRGMVIDEVHLVSTWGSGFRTEFQHLASYRKKMVKKSGGELKTLLLSATISNETEEFLADLFSPNKNMIILRANQLRPEINYWFCESSDRELREKRVLEAVDILPKPMILYVTKPQATIEWESRLRERGYQRIASYSGQTQTRERRIITDKWNNDELDIMVANSAFGLGVDKPDIRTVIHACIPESIDRFYQEVGRGGRDGSSSISLVCFIPDDKSIAFDLIKSEVITIERAWDRWKGMSRTIKGLEGEASSIIVDTDAPPLTSPTMRPSRKNREWNEHTLLLMQKAGLISIEAPCFCRLE